MERSGIVPCQRGGDTPQETTITQSFCDSLLVYFFLYRNFEYDAQSLA